MDYKTFLAVKAEKLKLGLANYANNNLYEHMQSPVKDCAGGHINGKVYRCHLVEDWLRWSGMDGALKQHIGVTSGVRDALRVLAQNGGRWLIPRDVYPVYKTLIQPAALSVAEYQTLGARTLVPHLRTGSADMLLLTDPLKPSATPYSEEEWAAVRQWLAQDKTRKAVVDGVYRLRPSPSSGAMALYGETNQLIILHSLSKSWLLPDHFGIALLPRNEDGAKIREQMKSLPKHEEKLRMAYSALNRHPDFPDVLKADWISKIGETNRRLNTHFPINRETPAYLFYDPNPWEYWLDKGILTIPSSVFGGDAGVVVSTLLD